MTLHPLQRIRELYAARYEPENMRPLAEFAWRLLIVLFACGLVWVVYFAVSVFSGVVGNLNGTQTNAAKAPSALDKGALEKLLMNIQDRQRAFDAVKTNFAPVAEPPKKVIESGSEKIEI